MRRKSDYRLLLELSYTLGFCATHAPHRNPVEDPDLVNLAEHMVGSEFATRWLDHKEKHGKKRYSAAR